MKITNIKPFIIWIGDRNQLIVKVETDIGLYGWGESGLSSRELAVKGAITHYAEILKGRDPMHIGQIWQELYRSQYFEGGRVLTAAIAAIDIALYDIKGKALGVPVYELLGGKQRDTIPTFGCVRSDDPDELIKFAHNTVNAGWNCLRLGWKNDASSPYEPRRHIAEVAEWMIAARQALGSEVMLGVDYHHRLSVPEAASFCQRMPRGTLDFLEEPIRDESPASYEALRKLVDVPFAIGEEFSSKWQFMPYIERDITQFARIDVCNVGGFTEAMKVAAWCEAHYIDIMPHNPLGPVCTAATVHFSAAVANLSYVECWETPDELMARQTSSLFSQQIRLDGAVYPLPEKPGLGIDIDEQALVSCAPFQFYEMPHLQRNDGAVTNW
ncbi:mandelate racemase/muconate lactonizing enzyme family protein [Citrobacter portucalensis]|uniref:mandelate racemase/muconate lactonizing enzyme family protein n=1 Tax=Citrobacter portucalensis TaxID=1639133 RepID=UPI00226B3BA4|nr:mandelate racemase/muconate lactonizing enzyme family protein [Citrobacter portucalensis]MCX9044892.1 mandelate racemase/muconate lactonizing enzyme family protein [Citrobacter portucalensis]